MTKKRPKTTDALMRYLREEKGISISGSSQKRKLMNIGYNQVLVIILLVHIFIYVFICRYIVYNEMPITGDFLA